MALLRQLVMLLVVVTLVWDRNSEHSVRAATTCETQKETCLSPELLASLAIDRPMTYREQGVLHCYSNVTSPACNRYRQPRKNSYAFRLNEHFSNLAVRKNHSIHLMDKKVGATTKPDTPRAFSLDLAVDARCHHSWPYNPYHRIADCLTFVLPALYNFFQLNFLPHRPSFSSEKVKLALIVDESSEGLCEFLNKKTNFEGVALDLSPYDSCLLHDFQELIRSRYYYQCVKVSIFSKSVYWYKLNSQVYIQTKEFIWLAAQKDPWASGSGFMNMIHPRYSEYLAEYRRLMLEGFCKYCKLPPLFPGHNIIGANRKSLMSLHNKQNLVLVLIRAPGTGRDFLQTRELLYAVRKVVKGINAELVEKYHKNVAVLPVSATGSITMETSTTPLYHIVPYYGINESTCETISLFWHAKVIIAAHGAGIVNTVFSRPSTLLIEITPDSLTVKGQPWRMNAPFAHNMGVSSAVIVIPHNESAKNDGEIQKIYSMSLSEDHIDAVANLTRRYLNREIDHSVQHKNITVMV
jgi:hypothetical protein